MSAFTDTSTPRSLSLLVNKHKSDWREYLDAVLFAYRVSANEATGYSPFYLTYGREPVLPGDVLYGIEPEQDWEDEADQGCTVGKTLAAVFEEVRE